MSSLSFPAIAVLVRVVVVCGLFVVRGRTDFETYLLLVPAASPPLAGPLRAARRPVQAPLLPIPIVGIEVAATKR